MADAAKAVCREAAAHRKDVGQIRDVIAGLADALPDVCINAIGPQVSPYIINMSFLGVKGEILVHALSQKNIYVSMGAACRSRKRAKPALELMGFSQEIAQSAIRFSFSPYNTVTEAETAREIIIEEVTKFRKVLR